MDFNQNTRISMMFKNLSIRTFICLILLSIGFLIIGFVYRNSCLVQPDLPIFLIIFGILILVNVVIYSILGTTFLACKCNLSEKDFRFEKIDLVIRRARSCSSGSQSIGICLSSLLGILFGIVIFIWWIIGTVGGQFFSLSLSSMKAIHLDLVDQIDIENQTRIVSSNVDSLVSSDCLLDCSTRKYSRFNRIS